MNAPHATAAALQVRAPARLHMGFVDLDGSLGRRFGSVGLTLEGLNTTLQIRPAAALEVSGHDAERARHYAATLCELFDLPPARIDITGAIPSHSGLGSGTQLALAVGMALARLHGLKLSSPEVAGLLDRGARSGIGIGSFDGGGFIVDGGRGALDAPPPIVAQMPFPTEWRMVLIFDHACRGLHGAAEKEAFRVLPPYKAGLADRLSRLVLMRALPALAERDIDMFGAAINELQHCVGDYFAPAQGGRYTSALVSSVAEHLAGLGAACIGQSSWGPTGFALAASEADANAMVASARTRFAQAEGLELMVCAARNEGAQWTELPG
ncbi:beta-ribofuranosylaminobenzene 5'-phosphate synthase family protein [Methyloversatilis discipulorum]|uniref:beta-ribofuranosylaminobenzene 5'-phosphate synthase family protein n=1 Tax=Methyloversatilis discipulorum TaxID=1119528 RepID=UPI003F2A48A1